VGFEAVAVPYVPDERAHGQSHFSPLRMIALALDGLTAFTVWPLRAVVALGFALALPAALALAQRFDDPELPACMRPLPARLLAGGLAATALASLGAW